MRPPPRLPVLADKPLRSIPTLAVKQRLLEMMPDLFVFLDVDGEPPSEHGEALATLAVAAARC